MQVIPEIDDSNYNGSLTLVDQPFEYLNLQTTTKIYSDDDIFSLYFLAIPSLVLFAIYFSCRDCNFDPQASIVNQHQYQYTHVEMTSI